jgi:hypothetical protein
MTAAPLCSIVPWPPTETVFWEPLTQLPSAIVPWPPETVFWEPLTPTLLCYCPVAQSNPGTVFWEPLAPAPVAPLVAPWTVFT